MAIVSRSSPRRVEAAIQRALVAWLHEQHAHVMVHASMNELAHKFMDMGSDVGIPDLLLFLLRDGMSHVLFLELKTTKGSLSASQREWALKYDNSVRGSNTCYAVAYGFEEAKSVCEKFIKEQS